MKRVVVVTLWVMSLGWAFTSAVQPAVSASAVVPAAAPVVHHKTARLCSTVVNAGQAACYAIRQTDTVQPPGVTANAVSLRDSRRVRPLDPGRGLQTGSE
jgi:hypothetical protein